jgi:hypothetical protein
MQGDAPKFTDAMQGATLQPRYMGRVVNTYPMSESEMQTISSLNGEVTAGTAVCTLLIGLAGGIWTNAIFSDKPPPEAVIATRVVAPIMLGFALFYGYRALRALKKRKSEWDRIKGETIPVQSMAGATPMISGRG